MSQQNSFFPSRFEVFQKENPERFARGRKGVGASAGKCTGKRSGPKEPPKPKIFNCETCGLWGKTAGGQRQLNRYGLGEKKIMFVGSAPSREEVRVGIPFVGPSGQLLHRMVQMVGLDLDRDCVRTNAVGCYPGQTASGADKTPTPEQIQACHHHLERDIEEVKPDLIICLGDQAINAVLEKPDGCHFQGKFSASMMHGIVVPDHRHNCWVASSYHPVFFLRRQQRDDVPYDENILLFDIARALGYIGKPLPKPLDRRGNIMLTDVEEAVTILEEFARSDKPTAFDYETFRLTPYEEDAELLSVALSQDPSIGYFIPINVINPETGEKYFSEEETSRIIAALRGFLASDLCPKVVQNLNMEETWSAEFLRQPMVNFHHDTMIAAHVLHCNTLTTGLAFQVFEMTGHDYKEMVDAQDLRKAPIEHLFHYNTWDARYTIMAYYYQQPKLQAEGRLAEFNQLLQRGASALARLRQTGVQISEKVLCEIEDQYRIEQQMRVTEMTQAEGVQRYLARKNTDVKKGKEVVFNPESPSQLGQILYKEWGAPILKQTLTSARTGIGSTDVDALEIIQSKATDESLRRFISSLFRFRKGATLLKRAANYRKVMDSAFKVHPCYNLNIADTYRSSANDPNIQNVFKHDKELKKFRRCIVPSKGRIILEVDYSGLEVRVIAMASKDVELTRQIQEGVDTHRRWAAEIYQKPQEDITSDERYEAKNGFVFASFYGAVPDSIARQFPTVPDGHIAGIQQKFWEEFQGVKAWQEQTIRTYVTCGYVEAVSGFRRYGPLTINKLYNTPIQGPAFHLLLDGLGRIYDELDRRGLKTQPIFEIHDSIAFDAVPSEAEEVVDLVTNILCSKRFDWQGDVPLAVEWEIGYSSWYDLAKLRFEHCESCGIITPHGIVTGKRKGAGDREMKFEGRQCGICGQKREIVLV